MLHWLESQSLAWLGGAGKEDDILSLRHLHDLFGCYWIGSRCKEEVKQPLPIHLNLLRRRGVGGKWSKVQVERLCLSSAASRQGLRVVFG